MVSKVVAEVLHVSITAGPEVAGVHWYTFSGLVVVAPQVPLWALTPLVAPTNVPPPAGTTTGLAHVPDAGSVVDVVEVLVVEVDVVDDVVVTLVDVVLVVVDTVVLVVVVTEVVETVEVVASVLVVVGAVVVVTLLDVVVGTVVTVVVVPPGGMIVKLKFPLWFV